MPASAQLRGQPETASLTLCGVHVEQHLLELDAHVHRELRAEAAMLGTDAGLHGADRLAVGVARAMPAALRSAQIAAGLPS